MSDFDSFGPDKKKPYDKVKAASAFLKKKKKGKKKSAKKPFPAKKGKMPVDPEDDCSIKG